MIFKKITTAYNTAKDFGFKWTAQRLFYELKLRTGHHQRRMPKRNWRKEELKHWLKKPFQTENIYQEWLDSKPQFLYAIEDRQEIADVLVQLYKKEPGFPNSLKRLDIHHPRYFTKLRYKVSFPDIWFTNPFLDPPVTCKRDQHWSSYPMYRKDYEDLKFIWEYGRFSIVFDMVRSYFVTQDDSLPEQFWTLVESWIDHNPPNTGPHWKCGQETSLRLMAWYFGLFAFKDHPATTKERFQKFLMAVAVQADRVSKDLNYSYLQHSNHAVSEGMGLFATALLFPQLKDADQWKERGKAILEDRVFFLIRPDGTYYQKSHNYLRFILHAYLFVLALAEVHEESFSDQLKNRLAAALDYLKSVIDPISGQTPNYGSNDGALVLPLNSLDLTDYQSVVAALHFYLYRERYFAPGPHQEDMVWLFGVQALDTNKYPAASVKVAPSTKYDDHGIYTLRSAQSWAFLHAESFRDRPAHADALHLDLWWQGLNICVDPGTYLYYGHQPWFDCFRHTRVHNTVCVDDQDQMDRAYRFTWGNWHTCQLNHWQTEGSIQSMELEHHGYQRLSDPVTHRRAVILIDQVYWIVIDDLVGKAQHDLCLHWLLNDFPEQRQGNKIHLNTPKGYYSISVEQCLAPDNNFEIIKGDPEKSIFGLRANYYGYLEKAMSLRFFSKGQLPIRYISCFGPQGWKIEGTETGTDLVFTNNKISHPIALNAIGQDRILKD